MFGRVSSFAGSLAPWNVSSWTFRYYRFKVTKIRDNTADLPSFPVGILQFAELEFLYAGTRISYSGATATNPGGSNPTGEEPDKGIDNNTTTKFLDRSGNGGEYGSTISWTYIIDFGAPRTVDSFRYCTANDVIGRDPVRWSMEGSSDNVNWKTIHTQSTDATITTSRTTYTQRFYLNRGGA
jgi:hypothetical protein